MVSPLMSLPRKIRDRIYELALCTQGDVQLIDISAREYKLGIHPDEGPRFTEPVEHPYPPVDAQPKPHVGDADSIPKSGRRKTKKKKPITTAMTDREYYEIFGPPEESKQKQYDRQFSFEKGTHFDQNFGNAILDQLAMEEEEDEEEEEEDADDNLEDEEGEEGEEGDESDSNGGEDMNPFAASRPRHRNSPCKLEALKPLNLSLLRVSRKVHEEALPVFYAGVTFIIDVDPCRAIRFFQALPTRAIQNVRCLAITSDALLGDDAYARAAWTISDRYAPKQGESPLSTPFATFITSNLPKLSEVYLAVPYGGDEYQLYATYAPIELEHMLAYGRISRLHYVFFGPEAAKDLRDRLNPAECYKRLMGKLLDMVPAVNEFQLLNQSTAMDRESTLKYYDQYDAVKDKHTRPFSWKWGNRDIDMGSEGNVQAVVDLWLDED